jgi:hypothetical protein
VAEAVPSAGAQPRPREKQNPVNNLLKKERIMEENINLTAERSLEIITQQIEQSRRAVSKTTGTSLYISGICIMCTSALVAAINVITMSHGMIGIGHLLWFLLPVAIWLLSRKHAGDHHPETLVGTLVAKTWKTFGMFAIGFFVIALAWGMIGPKLLPLEGYVASQIRVAPPIVLMMGMAITITGHILKQRWLVTFGIVAGLLCFAWEHFRIGEAMVMNLVLGESSFTLTAAAINASLPCLTIFIFGLVGLMLPGMMLKKQSA